ncbi:SDR family NAD(P)-dependent oxidoreductase [Alkalihalobacillus hemicellulosilyticus]|uniref:Probable short-chain dehydrogenase n=1 Tax=Halalkalibacter hemicellulosilyticusJCM 9152 TaxID=1236971 RepID=W4QK64_9BACI|nr:SDR family oxidoreductase [Halalkalibacter hemicellulosilyticus]GAE32307.1 probable short-chain dehydrogenase [Halalkalibacter hemicellulosilyticusJCM 9152]
MQQFLKGKVVLITGGSRGLGATMAETFADYGADVAISYSASVDQAEAVVEKLKSRGVRSLAIKSDQAELSSAKSLVNSVVTEFGKLDVLVNNAGITKQGTMVDDPGLDEEQYNRQWQVNVMGSIANTRASAAKLADGGRIIFIGSRLADYVPFRGVADYAGTKAALVGYSKGIARDLGPRNITVNVVQPGVMPTDMNKDVSDHLPPVETFLDMHPIRRFATLEEASEAVCFLAGPHGSYITGEVLNISGGVGI